MPLLSADLDAGSLTPLATLERVSYRRPGATDRTLRGVRLALQPGQFVGLFGRVGSGRSTLRRWAAGPAAPR